MMSRVCVVFLIFCLGYGNRIFSGEFGRPASIVEKGDGLPAVLARYPGGAFTRSVFRAGLATFLSENPSAFDLPEAFIVSEMVRRKRAQLEIAAPSVSSADRRMQLMAAELGGLEQLDRELAKVQWTRKDAWRAAYKDAEIASVAKSLLKLPPRQEMINEKEMNDTLSMLRREFRPLWDGVDVRSPLRVGRLADGTLLSLDELIDYVLREGSEGLLETVYMGGLENEIWHNEAALMGIENRENAIMSWYIARITAEDILQYYEMHREDLEVATTEWILIPWTDGGQLVSSASPNKDVRDATFVRTMRVRGDIRSGQMTFAEAARMYSADVVTKDKGGVLGHIPGAAWVISAGFSPEVWLLDYVEEGRDERRTPVVPAPDPALWEVVKSLPEGRLSEPVQTLRGFAIVQKKRTYPPPAEVKLRETLRRHLARERRAARRAELLEGVEFLWRPNTR